MADAAVAAAGAGSQGGAPRRRRTRGSRSPDPGRRKSSDKAVRAASATAPVTGVLPPPLPDKASKPKVAVLKDRTMLLTGGEKESAKQSSVMISSPKEPQVADAIAEAGLVLREQSSGASKRGSRDGKRKSKDSRDDKRKSRESRDGKRKSKDLRDETRYRSKDGRRKSKEAKSAGEDGQRRRRSSHGKRTPVLGPATAGLPRPESAPPLPAKPGSAASVEPLARPLPVPGGDNEEDIWRSSRPSQPELPSVPSSAVRPPSQDQERRPSAESFKKPDHNLQFIDYDKYGHNKYYVFEEGADMSAVADYAFEDERVVNKVLPRPR